MEKIAIVTLNGYFNYGNRLQNYALQETLKELNFEIETIIINNKHKKNNNTLSKRTKNLIKRPLNEIFKKVGNKAWNTINKDEINESKRMRTEIFKNFTYEYIKETDYTICDNNIPEKLSDKYDYFIAGSDQVWNPNYIYGSPIYFLTFAEKHKRIAYAPSFGISEIMPAQRENYKKWILGMNKLSVREDDGANIIKELTGREAPVLVDPTLLVTKEKWLSISKEAENKPKGKYLLTYFLGGVPQNYGRQIQNIAKDNNLEVINLGDIKEKETYRTGPSEFLDYVNSCSVFCTDSFHGAVFSILFEKPFIVYERMGSSLSMFSRINTLLDKFDLRSREVENIKTNEQIFNTDYLNAPAILESERNKSFDYLKQALNIETEG